jgi:tetratricopeptide (TPR) repeat protein
MKIVSIFVVLVFALVVSASAVNAMGDGLGKPKNTAKADYAAGKQAVNAARYDAAIALMSKVIDADSKNADAYNYLGFSFRKTGRLDRAAAAYKAALSLNPDHKGALEYQGELYLKQGNVKGARINIAHLNSLCRSGCKELSELKRALADFQATGGKRRGS